MSFTFLSPIIAGILACLTASLAIIFRKRIFNKTSDGKGLPPGKLSKISS